ncbi:MAG: family 16 glycosylhydrolase [Actinocatenispora sp.]
MAARRRRRTVRWAAVAAATVVCVGGVVYAGTGAAETRHGDTDRNATPGNATPARDVAAAREAEQTRSADGPPYAGVVPGTATPAGRRLVASDEFDGAGLDTSKWRAYKSLSSNKVSHFEPAQVGVADGEMRIVGHGRDASGKQNVSGAVCWCGTGGDQTYGIWAIKAKLDAGKGYAPAMMLWPKSNAWPTDGETDIIETVQPKRISDVASVHWGDPPSGLRESGKTWGDFTKWHVFWVDWQPTYIKIYVDRTLVYDTTTSSKHPVIPAKPMHLVLQQEPGPYAPKVWLPAPDGSTPDQVVVHVDWARYYQ